jgi:hypothetical protein
VEHTNRVLSRSELERLLSKKNFSWLTTPCRGALAKAIAEKKTTVILPRPGWTEFSIKYHDSHVFVQPSGARAPFTPNAWLNIERVE